MAQDQVEVMKHLGFEKFALVGHDRGGRAAHRLALDHPDVLTKLVILDIVPTYLLYQNITQEFATIFYHWFLLVQPPPFPETMVANSAEYFLKCTLLWLGGSKLTDPLPDWISPAVFQEYLRTFRSPETIHAICEDYRAAASIDLAHDKADLDKKIQCPLLVLWSEKGPFHRMYNVLQTWRDRAVQARGQGHADGPFPSGADAGGIDARTQSVSAELKRLSGAASACGFSPCKDEARAGWSLCYWKMLQAGPRVIKRVPSHDRIKIVLVRAQRPGEIRHASARARADFRIPRRICEPIR